MSTVLATTPVVGKHGDLLDMYGKLYTVSSHVANLCSKQNQHVYTVDRNLWHLVSFAKRGDSQLTTVFKMSCLVPWLMKTLLNAPVASDMQLYSDVVVSFLRDKLSRLNSE